VIEKRIVAQRQTNIDSTQFVELLVQHQDIVPAASSELERLFAGTGSRDVISLLRENALKRPPHPFVVASDQCNRTSHIRLGHDVASVRGVPAWCEALTVGPDAFRGVAAGRVVGRALATYQSIASARPCATLCVGAKESICRAFSIEAHENRMSPGRKASYCGTAREKTGSISARRLRIISKRWLSVTDSAHAMLYALPVAFSSSTVAARRLDCTTLAT
jgi:hypothetical protein